MAEQVLIQFRADKALKQVRGLPFEAVLPDTSPREDFKTAFEALRAEAADMPEMSLKEINAEISAARASRKKRRDGKAKK